MDEDFSETNLSFAPGSSSTHFCDGSLGTISAFAVREAAAALSGKTQKLSEGPQAKQGVDSARVALLLKVLSRDPDADVRESAVDALGNIADGAAYDALRAALTSKDAKVRRAAAEALGERRP